MANFFAAYLLAAFVVQIFIGILPGSLSKSFMFVKDLRNSTTKYVISTYGTSNNLEVNILAVLIVPFSILMTFFALISWTVMTSNLVYLNFWLILIAVFVVSNLSPSVEDMALFRDLQPISVMFFVFKIFLVLEVTSLSYPAYVTIMIFVLPISPLLQ